MASRVTFGFQPLAWPSMASDMCSEAHRLAAAQVEIPGWGKLVLFGIYGVDGEGMGARNARLTSALGAWCGSLGSEFVVAGDWNMEPSTLQKSGFVSELGCELVATEAGTCKKAGGKGYSKLDYFLVSSGVVSTVTSARLCGKTAANPHRPVHMAMAADLEETFVDIWLRQPTLPTELPMGCVPPVDQDALEEVRWL